MTWVLVSVLGFAAETCVVVLLGLSVTERDEEAVRVGPGLPLLGARAAERLRVPGSPVSPPGDAPAVGSAPQPAPRQRWGDPGQADVPAGA